MPRLPDVSDLGARQTPDLVRRVAQVPGGGGGFAALGDLGSGLLRINEDRQRADDAFNLAKAQSMVLQGSITAEGAAQEGQDWRKWDGDYSERMKGIVSEASQLITDPRQRELFNMDGATAALRGTERIKGAQKSRETDEGRASLDAIIAGNLDSAMGVEDEATRGKLLGSINSAISGAKAKGWISAEAAGELQRNTAVSYAKRRIDMMSPQEQLEAVGGGDLKDPASLIRRFEGYRATSYWDVNAHRAGFGSDTVTKADGTIMPVTGDSYVTWDDANRDLNRRIGEFQSRAREDVGPAFDALSAEAKAAITSVTYNYGEVPSRIRAAVRSGDNEKIADAVEALGSDNNGINAGRRGAEADVIRGSAPSLGQYLSLDDRLKVAHNALRTMDVERASAEKDYAAGFDTFMGAITAGADVSPELTARYSDEAIAANISDGRNQSVMIGARNDAQRTAGFARSLEGATPSEVVAIASKAADVASPPVRTETDLALAEGREKAEGAARALAESTQNKLDAANAAALNASEAAQGRADAANTQAERDAITQRAAAEKDYAAGFTDYVGAIGTGTKVDPKIAAKFTDAGIRTWVSDKSAQDLMIAARGDAVKAAQLAGRIPGAAPADQAAIAGAAVPPGVTDPASLALATQRAQTQASLQRALEADQAARAADPAAYVLKYGSPAAEAAAMLGKGGEDQYARATLAEQERIGITDPKLLPAPMAKATVEAIMKTPASERGQVVEQLAGQWGDHWPQVLNELKAQNLDPVVYHAALVADDPVLAEQVASLAEMPAKELEKGMPSDATKLIRDNIDAGLEDFRRTFETGDPTGAAAGTMNELRDVAYGVALQQYRNTGDTGGAVAYAVDRLVGERYHILDGGSFQGYVPKDFDPAKVEAMGDELLKPENIKAAMLAAPAGDTATPGFVQDVRIQQAAANGTWVTNAAGDGMVLMIDVDGRQTQVMTSAGAYGFKFADTRGFYVPPAAGTTADPMGAALQ